MAAGPIVAAIGASRVYGRGDGAVAALADADFAARAGEVVVLRGRSGSGKTTLLNLLGLLDRPTSGRIVFDGVETSAKSDRGLALLRRGALGYVLQDSGVIERMSALRNVMIPALYAGRGEGEARRLAQAALDTVEMGDKAGRKVGALSGGERMRVGLARALSLSPKLIVCDEPTASLDAETAGLVIQLLVAAADAGSCVMCASHDALVIERARRVVALERGLIVSDSARAPA